MTDHGNIYGAVHFFNAMQKKNLKPILGCELYISTEEDHRTRAGKYNHFLVLAENEAGYRNLVRLTSEAALHGFYNKPRVSKDSGKYDEAKRSARASSRRCSARATSSSRYRIIGLEPDKGVCDALFKMERELNIPSSPPNDSHYVAADDSPAPTRSCSASKPPAA